MLITGQEANMKTVPNLERLQSREVAVSFPDACSNQTNTLSQVWSIPSSNWNPPVAEKAPFSEKCMTCALNSDSVPFTLSSMELELFLKRNCPKLSRNVVKGLIHANKLYS